MPPPPLKPEGRYRIFGTDEPLSPHELAGDVDHDIYATDLLTGETDKLTDNDVGWLVDVAEDGSRAIVRCTQKAPDDQSLIEPPYCLLDRATRTVRSVPGDWQHRALINGDGTKVVSALWDNTTVFPGTNLFLWTIEPAA